MLLTVLYSLELICALTLADCPISDRETYLVEQTRLHKDLFSDYNAGLSAVTMQVANSSLDKSVELPRYRVLFTLGYLKMIRMVEPEQKVEFLFEYALDWRDERLKWNASDYCGIEHIYVLASNVWIPEITIVDAHSSEDYRDDYKKFVRIESSGDANFFIPTLTATVCTIDVNDFPFDQQECSINMMTQSFSAYEYGINITIKPEIVQQDFVETVGNAEWRILKISMNTTFYDTGDYYSYEMARIRKAAHLIHQPQHSRTAQLSKKKQRRYGLEWNKFIIQMKRNPSFYISMIITPSFVINILSIFGVFLKSADSMGKLGMALTNIMSLTFVLGILATALPKTQGLPRIAIYVMVNLFIMVFALTTTLFLPYLKRYLAGRIDTSDCGGGKKKRKADVFYKSAEYGLCALLELANLINFLVLVA